MSVARETHGDAVGVEALHMTMAFGDFKALDDVSICIRAGTFHALLGENGAGKSTLVKCIMGFYQATSGELLVGGREALIQGPKAAQDLGLGMVYQHFTLVPSLTGAENLVISRADAPQIIDWAHERQLLAKFMDEMPFRVPLDRPVSQLSAGETQKLEILKQLYLGNKFLILDEPTSVLTPAEAQDVLGHVRALTQAGALTVLMITHKFREVTAFADEVSILRRGKYVAGGAVSDMSVDEMSHAMMGGAPDVLERVRTPTDPEPVMTLRDLKVRDQAGLKDVEISDLTLKSGEILGVAGISGNGQVELMELLTGQRRAKSGSIEVNGEAFAASRAQARAHGLRYLPEAPLQNACAPTMSVAENLAFRVFDVREHNQPSLWKSTKRIAQNAAALIEAFKIKTTSASARISSLSGGNIQRAVLARELTGDVKVLIVSNPCFGLDFAAVTAIRDRLMTARNQGTAILLLSEDLDEIMELSDRVLVMSDGRIAFETPIETADVAVIGQHMAGHHSCR